MKILRKIIQTDLQGRLLSEHAEELYEDDDGNVLEMHTTASLACPACDRILEKPQDIRRCIECGRNCCSSCSTVCSICHRGPICGSCVLGFAEQRISVCLYCLQDLQERLSRQDRLLDEKIKFERLLTTYSAISKLTQSANHERGTLSEIILDIANIHLAGKLSSLTKRIEREDTDDRRYLP